MKSKIHREVKHSLLIEKDDLQTLGSFLSERYEAVEIAARCIDGTILTPKDANELLEFENPGFRRIRRIEFEASTDYDERCIVTIQEGYDETADIVVASAEDLTAHATVTELSNRLREMKPWYDIIARYQLWTVLWVLSWGYTVIGTTLKVLGVRPWLSSPW